MGWTGHVASTSGFENECGVLEGKCGERRPQSTSAPTNEYYLILQGACRPGSAASRIPVGARFSAPVQTGPGAHPASCTIGTGSFPGIKSGRGVTLTPHTLLVPWS